MHENWEENGKVYDISIYIIEIIDDYQNTEVDNSSRQLQKLHEKLKITDRPSKIDGPKVRHRPGIFTPVLHHTAEMKEHRPGIFTPVLLSPTAEMKEKVFDDESPSSQVIHFYILSHQHDWSMYKLSNNVMSYIVILNSLFQFCLWWFMSIVWQYDAFFMNL